MSYAVTNTSEGSSSGFSRAREIDAVHGIHLDVEEQELGPLGPDLGERGGAVAVFADHGQIALGLAVLAQRAAARELVIDDDDAHHAAAQEAHAPGAAAVGRGMDLGQRDFAHPFGVATARP